MTTKFIEKFEQLEVDIVNEQRRIPTNSCLKIFYGITSEKYYRISFVSTIKPFELESTKEIKVTQGKESENVYWTCFDLIHHDAKEVFFIFCDSLIDSVENINNEFEALVALKEKYYSWRQLLKNKGKMSYEAYQGLFGELFFLSEYLSQNINIEQAISSWVGPDGYSKDFSINNSWFEIKTIGTSSISVKINSLDQLDSDIKGHLVTIIVEKMSDQFDAGLCSVPTLYHSILSRINSHKVREEFINKVLKYGYLDDDTTINNHKFEVKRIVYYEVDKEFPKLTRNNIKTNAISEVQYNILISAIEKYMEEI